MWTLKFKRKPKPEMPVEAKVDFDSLKERQCSGLILKSGFQSHKFHYYSSASNSILDLMRHAYSKSGVECVTSLSPTDLKTDYYFRNDGKQLVLIEWNESDKHFLEPGESVTVKVNLSGLMDNHDHMPRVTALNGGL